MASVTLKNLNKLYRGSFLAVNNVSAEIGDGEFAAFYGKSGCGKFTLLRMIGGLEDISSGEIYLGDELLNDVLPRDRKLAMAFPNYRLYGYLNVFDNMSVGLKLRNLPRAVINARVAEAADFLGISCILDKKIKHITPLQKKKTALGRAIVCQPKVLLVDESFLHDDELIRREILRYLRKINRKLKITILYSTHTYADAETAASKIFHMENGEIVKVQG
ncbi:MAG: ABC transporter ATP-binding protein [Schaedlerella sp.]|nr:ABC transporter ATP-binding protein [Schaedlerella sp.]